jgi:hypothetical protein
MYTDNYATPVPAWAGSSLPGLLPKPVKWLRRGVNVENPRFGRDRVHGILAHQFTIPKSPVVAERRHVRMPPIAGQDRRNAVPGRSRLVGGAGSPPQSCRTRLKDFNRGKPAWLMAPCNENQWVLHCPDECAPSGRMLMQLGFKSCSTPQQQRDQGCLARSVDAHQSGRTSWRAPEAADGAPCGTSRRFAGSPRSCAAVGVQAPRH